MLDYLKQICDWLQSNTLLANLAIPTGVLYIIIKDFIKACAKKTSDTIKEKTNISKEDIEKVVSDITSLTKDVDKLNKAIGIAYKNSKLDTSVKLRIEDELNGKETNVIVVEEPKIEEKVETVESVVEKLEKQL